MINISDLKKHLNEYDKDLNLYSINYEQIKFEECVKINCFYCSNYNEKWTCPPRIPDLNYKEIFNNYENIAVIIYEAYIRDDFENLRNKSTNKIHSALLELEKYLWENNNPTAISFIGGSCKLCKNNCALDKCKNKGISRIPVEALGINVIKTLKNINIEIIFPVNKILTRCGILLW